MTSDLSSKTTNELRWMYYKYCNEAAEFFNGKEFTATCKYLINSLHLNKRPETWVRIAEEVALHAKCSAGIVCPGCLKGVLKNKTSKFGIDFRGCSTFPECRYTENDTPKRNGNEKQQTPVPIRPCVFDPDADDDYADSFDTYDSCVDLLDYEYASRYELRKRTPENPISEPTESCTCCECNFSIGPSFCGGNCRNCGRH